MSLSEALEKEVREKMLQSLAKREGLEAELEHATEPEGTFQDRIRTFARLELWRRELEDALAFCKDKAAGLSDPLLEEMALAGMKNANCEGLKIYPISFRYVNKKKEVSKEQLVTAMRECGLGDLIREDYQPASLKAAILEMIDQGVAVPDKIAEMLSITDEIRLTSSK